jgi:hypothetical protein
MIVDCRLIVACLMAGLPGIALAQETARSFERASLVVSPGQTVTVVDDSGVATKGKLSIIAAGNLVLDVDGDARTFREGGVREIQVRPDDSLANGVLIGAAIGGALGGLPYLDNECHGDPACVGGIAFAAGIGAGAGALIDLFIRSRRLIYERPPVSISWILRPISAARSFRMGARLTSSGIPIQ